MRKTLLLVSHDIVDGNDIDYVHGTVSKMIALCLPIQHGFLHISICFDIQKLHFSIEIRAAKIHFSIEETKQMDKKVRKKSQERSVCYQN